MPSLITGNRRRRGSSISDVTSVLLSPLAKVLHLTKEDANEPLLPSSPVAALLNFHGSASGNSGGAGAVGLGSDDDDRRRVELRIGGMTCGACVAAIEGQIGAMEGIESVQVSLLAERAVVVYDTGFLDSKGLPWTDAKVASEIEDVGFDAEVVAKSEITPVQLTVYG